MSIKKNLLIKLKVLSKKILFLLETKTIEPKDKFSMKNFGIIKRLDNIQPSISIVDKNEFIKKLLKIFGIQVEYPFNLKSKIQGIKSINKNLNYSGVLFDESYFISYDNLKIPIYILYPPNFDIDGKYPTIVLFSGHGSAKQVAFEVNSYQHACGSILAKNGFLVYIMENRGMGKLSYLGNHLRIDAVARIIGGTWYGEILTDALWLIENLHNEPNVDEACIGTAGVSTGGAISMIIASLDERIAAAYVQGFLGSYKKTFGTRGSHCLCGHIPNILDLGDMSDIASLIAPRPVLFVNGTKDSFYTKDADMAFEKIKKYYKNLKAEQNSKFIGPEGIKHEFSVDIALKWFNEKFKF